MSIVQGIQKVSTSLNDAGKEFAKIIIESHKEQKLMLTSFVAPPGIGWLNFVVVPQQELYKACFYRQRQPLRPSCQYRW